MWWRKSREEEQAAARLAAIRARRKYEGKPKVRDDLPDLDPDSAELRDLIHTLTMRVEALAEELEVSTGERLTKLEQFKSKVDGVLVAVPVAVSVLAGAWLLWGQPWWQELDAALEYYKRVQPSFRQQVAPPTGIPPQIPVQPQPLPQRGSRP